MTGMDDGWRLTHNEWERMLRELESCSRNLSTVNLRIEKFLDREREEVLTNNPVHPHRIQVAASEIGGPEDIMEVIPDVNPFDEMVADPFDEMVADLLAPPCSYCLEPVSSLMDYVRCRHAMICVRCAPCDDCLDPPEGE